MSADRRRLVGVDVARGLALIGMMSVHVLPPLSADGSTSTAFAISAGRASALFALLAGVGLALARVSRPGLVARAAVVAAIGLTLGMVPSPVAVILAHYGLLFLCALPFVRLRSRTLFVLGGGWLVAAPVLAHALRAGVDQGPGANPSWLWLGEPGRLALDLALTGYYPVLSWTGYVLVGLAVGKLALSSRRTAGLLLAAGTGLAVAAKTVSWLLLGPFGGDRFVDSSQQFYGTTPTDTWWWLAVSAPHTGTPLDLLHTTGTSMAVLGGCLLLASLPWRAARYALLPLAAAGAMTLTLYTWHVLALGLGLQGLWVHVLAVLLVATVWKLALRRRGPLEGLAAAAARAAG